MRKAQESTLMLKSVIIPLEAEINQLKIQLKEAKEKISELEALVNIFDDFIFKTFFHFISAA
jgi:hypothetical protein